MARKLNGIELTRYDDLFKTDFEREADRQERVQIVPAEQVFPYVRQPYSVDRPSADLVRLMDSIERTGIAEPLIVRPRSGGGYEIISGHRRDYCAKVVGLDTRPVIVREYSDEDADILVVDYNINRENLLPSEKAKAYKLKLDAMKRQGARTDLTSLQSGEKLNRRTSVKVLAEQAEDNVTAIQRYIRLTNLIPPLMEAVDTGKLKFVPAADYISRLTEKEQTYLQLVMERDEVLTLRGSGPTAQADQRGGQTGGQHHRPHHAGGKAAGAQGDAAGRPPAKVLPCQLYAQADGGGHRQAAGGLASETAAGAGEVSVFFRK